AINPISAMASAAVRTNFPLSTGARVAVATSSLVGYQRVEHRRPRCPKRTAAHEMAKTSGLGGSQPAEAFASAGEDIPKGTVKWFNATKGYGFIQPQGGGKDIFVHISAVERAGFSTLSEGQVVQYEEVSNRGRTAAENLRIGR